MNKYSENNEYLLTGMNTDLESEKTDTIPSSVDNVDKFKHEIEEYCQEQKAKKKVIIREYVATKR